jgi:hypothetical protein
MIFGKFDDRTHAVAAHSSQGERPERPVRKSDPQPITLAAEKTTIES